MIDSVELDIFANTLVRVIYLDIHSDLFITISLQAVENTIVAI